MKKVVSVFLVVLLMVSFMPYSAFAAEKDTTPFIVLQGYSGPRLDDADSGKQVWGLDFSKVKDRIVEALPKIAGTAGATFAGDTTQLVDILGGILLETLEPIACNPDGTSKYNVVPHIQSAEQARVSTLRANGEEDLIAEKELVAMVEAERGADNVFIFHFDWRKGQIAYAKAIDEFIQEVKALTDAQQVDIFGLSHGGQCGASYLYYYGWKGDARKVILDVPAIGGTTMVGDPLCGNPLNLNYATILEFVELAMGTEEEFEWLIKYIGYENLNAVLTDLCERYIVDFIKYIPSIWDFCPLAVYEEAKEKRLDPIENAEIIAASDAFHYGAMQHMSEGLCRAQNAGTNIAIITNYGHENVTGSNINSDYIIDTVTSSGATCAPFDGRFPSSYTAQGTICQNNKHLHISPERNVDATTAYLPDNTWFVNGQFHGMYVFDPYTVDFVKAFFFTDAIQNVFSDSKFPQFNSAQNPIDSLYIRFDGTAPGYHSAADQKLLICNLSSEYDIAVRFVQVNGANIEIKPNALTRIAAGETGYITLPVHEIVDCDTPFDITVIYTLFNNQTQLKSKTFTFTPLSNADAAKYSYLITAADFTESKDLGRTERNTENTNTTNSDTGTTADAQSGTPTAQDNIPKTQGQAKTVLPFALLPIAAAVSALCIGIRRKRAEEF